MISIKCPRCGSHECYLLDCGWLKCECCGCSLQNIQEGENE